MFSQNWNKKVLFIMDKADREFSHFVYRIFKLRFAKQKGLKIYFKSFKKFVDYSNYLLSPIVS